MKLNAALDIAFECMKHELKLLYPHHNDWEQGDKRIGNEVAHERYISIVHAMQRLEELKHQGRLFG